MSDYSSLSVAVVVFTLFAAVLFRFAAGVRWVQGGCSLWCFWLFFFLYVYCSWASCLSCADL